MFILNGKYNIAKIMLPFDNFEDAIKEKAFDEETKKQIEGFLNHQAFKGEPPVIMPDCHAGKGAVIGFTMPMNDYIIPNIVGVDINCSMLSYNLGKIDVDRKKLDEWVIKNINVGKKVYNHKNPKEWIEKMVSNIDLENFFSYVEIINIEVTAESIGKKDKIDYFFNSLGTLGGGNHFIELGIDETQDYWLTIHSGSRNFGLQVANYHQQKAVELCSRFFKDEKDLAFLPMEYGGEKYLKHMRVAQQYASLNRMIMMYRIVVGFFKQNFVRSEALECPHNYIDFEDKIIRKGAISAQKGKVNIIPFNMEDGLIIGIGKGNKEWNYSAPHGAGRLMSRKKAKEILYLPKAKASMEAAGVYTTSLNADTLDEVKDAYKNKDMIIEAIKETVEIKHFVKPVWNLKAGE